MQKTVNRKTSKKATLVARKERREHRKRIDWWPSHVRNVFAALGQAMGGKRLTPKALLAFPNVHGSVLPDHDVVLRHTAGKENRKRKGFYTLEIDGPRFAGRWRFMSGELEVLSRSAAADAQN